MNARKSLQFPEFDKSERRPGPGRGRPSSEAREASISWSVLILGTGRELLASSNTYCKLSIGGRKGAVNLLVLSQNG